ncbi:hypothetical protein RGCCGE502_05594 [Rhizobium grahamii CCGE 502]|uniref:Uncharacterized protein n=1 Tax=Rhizobium grahamii CCGE 502 TaxID=990285 RepID=S3I287_9HYPH|nr:hypothetical protein RGCCGE502_05594 [Rhizobium grahamii CCGE 502]
MGVYPPRKDLRIHRGATALRSTPTGSRFPTPSPAPISLPPQRDILASRAAELTYTINAKAMK